jgi:hypothetical protein
MTTDTTTGMEYLTSLLGVDNYLDNVRPVWVKQVIEADPDIAVFIERLLSTGTETAHSAVFSDLERNLQLFDRGYEVETLPPNLNYSLIAAWTAGNAIDEMPDMRTFVREGLPVSISGLNRNLQEGKARQDRTDNVGYWRGLAALCISDLGIPTVTPEHRDAAERFALTHGGRVSLRQLVDLINDRGSFDADLISDLFQQSDGVAPSLRDGVL